jgi:hypothetical protein
MDELTMLRQFRADVPRSLQARRQARERLEQLTRGGRRRRPRLVIILAAFALLIALGGTAYGLAREYLLGDPAPDPVKEQAAMLNEVKGELIPKATVGPGIRAEETKLAAFLDASTGPVYLWVAPSDRGECLFMQIVGTEQPDGRPNLSGGCGRGNRVIDWGIGATRVRDGRLLPLLSGSVGAEVARLELRSEGATTDVPLQGRYFLLELSGGGNKPHPEIPRLELIAYDAAGQELARQKSRPPFNPAGRASGPQEPPRPIDLTGQRPLIAITTRRTGKPIQLYVLDHVADRGGQRCEVLVTPGGTSTGCGGRSIGPTEVWVSPNQIGTSPNGMLLLWGEVGSQISRLELHFEDGRIEQLPLMKQFALYQVDPADFAAGRRPLRLLGRDQNGKAVGERKLGPWRR